MLTGEVLFEGETPAMAMTKHLIEGPQFHQSLPADWEPLLLNCLAMDPEARYLSVEALPMDIERAFSGTSGTVKNSQTPKEAPSEDAAEVLDEQDNLASEQSEPGLKLESVREAEDVVGTPTQITLRTKRESDKTAQAVDSANKSGKKELLGALFGAFLTIAVTVTILVFLSKHWSALTNPPIKTEVRQKDGMTMVYVPAGKFEMGSEDGYSDEKPVHTVELSAYWIDKYEVSNGQYAKCVAAGVCTKPSSTGSNKRSSYYDDPEYENYPVIYVDWHQASAYCQWAGGQLPTEAEWEKAARGTDGRTWPWGNQNPNCNLVNFDNCEGDTSPVTDYKEGASPYGALNMAGNVWKWVRDVYSNSYPSGQVKDPTGPTDGDRRVLRGGSWVNVDRVIRAANRNYSYPTSTFNNYGFRCILPQP
jgi:serine/threonine-protein kinase